jgi:uncharacterized RDD family membrane protein YckC
MIGRRSDRGPEALVVPERMLAGALDLAFFATIASLLLVPAFVFDYEKSLWPDAALVGLAYAAYFVGGEYFFQTTPGKFLCGLRIFTPNGAKPSITRVLARNLIRPIDALPILYFVGLLFVGATERAQRLGDLAAGTVVRNPSRTHSVARETRLGHVGLFAILGLMLLFALLSTFFGWISDDATLGMVVFLVLSAAACFLIVLGDDNARYGMLAAVIGLCATAGAGFAWMERENAYLDDRAEIRSNVTHKIPLGTPEADALASLASLGAYTSSSAETAEDGCYRVACDAVPAGKDHAMGYFSEAFPPPWFCGEGDYIAVLILEEGRVTDIRFEELLGGCL